MCGGSSTQFILITGYLTWHPVAVSASLVRVTPHWVQIGHQGGRVGGQGRWAGAIPCMPQPCPNIKTRKKTLMHLMTYLIWPCHILISMLLIVRIFDMALEHGFEVNRCPV